MKNTFKVLGIIAVIAIIGFSMTACGDGDDSGDSNGSTPTITHTHVWGAWTVTTPATCVAKGVETHTCTLDPSHKETRETAIDTEAHDWEVLEGTAPTCTTDGNGKEKCKLCGIEENGVLPKLGHDYGEWVTTKAPTETEDGREERTCAHDATHKETNAIAALNHTHDWGDWSVTTPATCTANGEKVRVCKLNATHKDIEDIDALDHDWGNWEQTTAPTCTAAGVETQTCKRDASHKETRTGAAALGHSYAWVATTPATCETAGVETGTCTRDGSTTTRTIAALEHNYQWQATTPATLTSEGVETEICTHDSTHTRDTRPIPQIPFTSIAALGTWLTSQPANNASTPYTVKLNVSDLGGSTAIAGSVGYVLNTNKYVSLDLSGSTFTSIPYDDVNDRGAFETCTYLTSVTIGSSVTNIGDYAFVACTSLTTINVVAGNSAYTAENGVLYNKAKTVLIQYPAGKIDTSFAIPNSVMNIGDYAFDESVNLTSVTIPNSVNSIGESAFQFCENLASVTFAMGSNISNANFGNNAFLDSYRYYGNKLKTAYSTGKAGTYIYNIISETWSKQ